MRIKLNFRWCFQNEMWLLIVAQRSQTSYDLKFLIVTRTKWIVYRFQSRDANRDNYNNDSNVRFFLLKDWFASINWLELELQLNMFIIQTNRCFIKSKIRDSLCIRRFFIEIFNDYRISLINDFIVIFTVFETRICEIFLITSFDAYIEICSLKFESRSESRLLVSSLNRCKSFIRLWFASLQKTCLQHQETIIQKYSWLQRFVYLKKWLKHQLKIPLRLLPYKFGRGGPGTRMPSIRKRFFHAKSSDSLLY